MAPDQRILILGGSHSELPLIRSAQSMGLEVVTSGNQPDHPGHSLAKFYLPGDFSNLDQMEDVFLRSGCSYVVAAANDYAYLTACQLAQRHALPGFDPAETAFALHHKNLFKPMAYGLGMPVTRFKVINALFPVDCMCLGLEYPLIVKPVDLTGGKGMTVVSSPDQLSSAISHALSMSRQPELVIEEFFEGSLHSYSTLIVNGKVVFDYSDNEFCFPNPFLVSTSTSIANVPSVILDDLKHQTEKLAGHLRLCDGVLHAQFLYQKGDYRILEYTRRCSGDLYSTVVEEVTGLKHADQFIRCSLGLPVFLKAREMLKKFVSRHCVFAPRPGLIQAINVDKLIAPYVKSITPAWPKNHYYKNENFEKAAVVLLDYKSQEMMTEFTPHLHDLIRAE